ncbi:MAG: sulfur carrier protein ThiS adenylyltransferase ThiF [Firmicutes bacterium]|nr:sulfur carrier protein ThiS adenylyltransferase ThiF [Bacillota bacterium]
MNEFEKALRGFFGPAALAKIQQVRVGIAGAGGLGSNCAQFLARSGFRNFKIVDFDEVEYSNLNRQCFFFHQVGETKVAALKKNLLQINPDIRVDTLQVKIEPDNIGTLFEDSHAVIEALDRPEYKKLVVESYLLSGKLLVAASGLAGWGNTDAIKIRKVKEHFYLVGDLVSEVQPHCPPVAPAVVITAAKQADVVLSYFLGKCEVKENDL